MTVAASLFRFEDSYAREVPGLSVPWTAASAPAPELGVLNEELAVELDRTPDQIEELLRTSRQPISLDSTIGEDGETSIGGLSEDVDAPEASELVDRQLMAEQLRSALDALTPREATIMAMRFGLYDGNPHTLDEIGRALGLTRERIRQLEKQSLSKLRHPSRAQPLLDFAS